MMKVLSRSNSITLSKLLSLPNIFQSRKPKEAVENGLVMLLKKHLKDLGITWNPKAFAAGLTNSKLPSWLLEKLENLIAVAEASGWRISCELKSELDETIEDIETFNPAFRKSLKASRASGSVSGDSVKAHLGL